MNKYKCENCGKEKSKYEEWSPDGAPYYFCTMECYLVFKEELHKKGLAYRSLPLRRLRNDN